VRFRSKPIAALSIVLVLAGALGGWHTPDDQDDYVPVSQQHTDHEVRGTATTLPPAEHCALCHWLQALGKAAPASPQVLTFESSQLVRAAARLERVRTADLLTLPSRAPPLA
jgi:hypothetical protein